MNTLQEQKMQEKANGRFFWGVATSAYQIEGAAYEDGKSLSIWDVFTHQPNHIVNNGNGDVSIDHYHRWENDFKWLKKLGVNSYRLSIAWSRIFPNSNRTVNTIGLQFYDNIVNRLLHLGIEPIITLYHWDMPQYLEELGGFLNRTIVDEFANYASFIAKHFRGRVKYYITINEPQCVIEMGLHQGRHAPGKQLDIKQCLLATHHLLLCHGLAVQKMREVDQNIKIGIALTSSVVLPTDKNNRDMIDKAKTKQFAINYGDFFSLSLFGDPIFLKNYPSDYYVVYKGLHPIITKDDLTLIATPVDICYANLYSGYYVGMKNSELVDLPFPLTNKIGSLPWLKFAPETIYYGTRFLYERYGKPIIISENGACVEENSHQQIINDKDRIEYLLSYLAKLDEARKEGVAICGYFYWTLFDNFEWAEGYSKRFGLIHVDLATQTRKAKKSFYIYRNYIKKHK